MFNSFRITLDELLEHVLVYTFFVHSSIMKRRFIGVVDESGKIWLILETFDDGIT